MARFVKPLRLTNHLRTVAGERDIDMRWIEATVRVPDWTEPDPRGDGTERRFRAIEERSGRVLRVAVFESDGEIRILTAFFDRNARKPK